MLCLTIIAFIVKQMYYVEKCQAEKKARKLAQMKPNVNHLQSNTLGITWRWGESWAKDITVNICHDHVGEQKAIFLYWIKKMELISASFRGCFSALSFPSQT
uniref:Uncharacterized protein n=1 Tax=Micrurus paraensis TaxID=1970185 RepID=A0A2D4JVF6_9SAUR